MVVRFPTTERGEDGKEKLSGELGSKHKVGGNDMEGGC